MREGVTEGAARTNSTVKREQQKGWEEQDIAEGYSKKQERFRGKNRAILRGSIAR